MPDLTVPGDVDWGFWMPLTKSFLDENAPDGQRRRIEGVASTGSQDFQKERLNQLGLDFDYFLQRGYFNWNHKDGPDAILGVPDRAEVRDGDNGMEFFVGGYLYNTQPADNVWHLMQEMKRGPVRRQLGFSVQGSVKARDPKDRAHITKSIVRHVAITHEPINSETWANIAKSMTVAQVQPLLKEDLDSRITSLLWGDQDVTCGHFGPQDDGGRFHSMHDVVEHLVECLGHSPQSARRALLKLLGSGIFTRR